MWDPTKPEEGGAFESAPIRRNMEALEAGTHPDLLITNVKVAVDAAIRLSKFSSSATDATLAQLLQSYKQGMYIRYGGAADTLTVGIGQCMSGGQLKHFDTEETVNWGNLEAGNSEKASTWYDVFATASTPSEYPVIKICEQGNVPAATYYTYLGWFYNNAGQNIEEFRSIGNAGVGSINFYYKKGPSGEYNHTGIDSGVLITDTDFDIYTKNGCIALFFPMSICLHECSGAGQLMQIWPRHDANDLEPKITHQSYKQRLTLNGFYMVELSAGVHTVDLYALANAGDQITFYAIATCNQIITYEL